MLKYFAAIALFVASPVKADPVVPGIGVATVTIASVTQSKENAHRVIVQKAGQTVEILIGGCPAPKPATVYYMIGIPDVGVFTTPKALLDTTLKAKNNDFAAATGALIDAHQMCAVVGAKALPMV